MNCVVYFVFLSDDPLIEQVGELFDEALHVRYGFFVSFDLDPVSPGIYDDTIGVLDEPEVLIHVSEKTRQGTFVFYDKTCCGGFHCVDTAISECPYFVYMVAFCRLKVNFPFC